MVAARRREAFAWSAYFNLLCRTLGELSNDVKEFIADHVHSVIRLEVLLLLTADADKTWSTEAVERKLNLPPQSAEAHLDELLSQGLLILAGEAPKKVYRYSPSSNKLDVTVGRLSKAYATQRVAVLTLIFANPVDKVRLFTETFRMINGEGEVKRKD